jgi:hypothetical protein
LQDGAMLASNRRQARQAIDIFTFRISCEITKRRDEALSVLQQKDEPRRPSLISR